MKVKIFFLITIFLCIFVTLILLFVDNEIDLTEHKININDSSLSIYTRSIQSDYLIVFESGLGNDHKIWIQSGILEELSKEFDILVYDRAGYGKSGNTIKTRSLENISDDLAKIIDEYSKNKKIILVGHSYGGLIIRDYAIKHPEKINGILFVDPSHENYNSPLSEEKENYLYDTMVSEFGVNFGGSQEARQLNESFSYSSKLKELPNVPTIVLTSMKNDSNNIESDKFNNKTRQDWYDAHEILGKGLDNFNHVGTELSGHYIMLEEPSLLIKSIKELINHNK